MRIFAASGLIYRSYYRMGRIMSRKRNSREPNFTSARTY
jgi:hypothetical protein